jgi:quinoprotein dehydrogenase-associated probable ABC transporter substrate-binding protein
MIAALFGSSPLLRRKGPLRVALLAAALLGPLTSRSADLGAAPADAGPAPSGRVLAVCSDPANLPYSNERQEGFENRIASLIAQDLHAEVRYTWNSQRRSFLRRTLKAGECDVVMGMPMGLQGVAQTRPYYASSYAFVSARSRHLNLHSFDDPVLRGLKIGLPALSADGANPPPTMALAKRGLADHVVGFSVWGNESDETPQSHIVDAVAAGDIDVAVVWGPFAGYFAQRYGDQLEVTPVDDDPLQPGIPFRFALALSVRPADEALRDELQAVLDKRQPEIEALLKDYGIPLVSAK